MFVKSPILVLIAILALAVVSPSAASSQVVAREAATGRFEGEVAAAKAAMMADPETALAHARNATSLGRTFADARRRRIAEATGQWLEGEALQRVNRPQEARAIVERALATAARDAPRTKLHADLLKARAGISLVTGSVQSALADLLTAHDMFRALGEPRSEAIVLQNLGSIYLEAHDYERALRYYEQANEVYGEDPALALAAHNNRGNAFKELGRYGEAEAEFQLALEAARAIRSDLLQARILTNLASAQLLRGDLRRAEATAQLGLRISTRSAVGWEPYLWGVRAQIALARGDLHTAKRYIESTFTGVDLNESTMPYRDFHDAARQIYFRLGNAESAFRHFTAFKRLDDEARNVAASTSSALMAARFDAANQQARIARLTAEQLQREAALAASRQRLERVMTVGGVSLVTLLIILAVGFFAFRAVRRSRNKVAEANVKLTYAARHDALTGLPNRRYVRELLQDALDASESEGADCALMLIDLDRFKKVNDTLGHEAGDALLLEVGHRLHRVLPAGAQAGRLGGDEFAAVVRGVDQEQIDAVAGATIEALSEPYSVSNTSASVGASIGIASGGPNARTVHLVTRNADLALYRSKHTGRGKHTFFEAAMLAEAEERLRIETELRTALLENQFAVAYQPIVDAQRGEIVAFEALVRWQHPSRGEILPSHFIRIAEEAGLIRHIGDWVLRTACSEAAKWPEHVKLAVNLSAVQVEAEGLVASVVSSLAHSGLAPARLEFEVTESVFLREGQGTGKTLDALRALGVSLALDDFGTGYSSLGYLQRTDFSKIKIDRSFVKSAADGCQESIAIIEAIVSMAKGLGMTTTAEGVETEAERRLVRKMGCSQIQGYLIGRPQRRETPETAAAEARDEALGARVLSLPERRRGSRAA